jgi:TPR repeat protein
MSIVDPRAEYKEMMTLGGIYETESEDVSKNWAAAFACYEKAARMDGPEAYLGLSRLCRLACIATEDDNPDQKTEYANYIRITCDPDTITRFGWPEIALNVGVTCEHMGEFTAKNSFPEKIVREHYNYAAQYFALAAKMEDIHHNDAPALSAKALSNIQERGYGLGQSSASAHKPETLHL